MAVSNNKINTEIGLDINPNSVRSVKELTRDINQLGRETKIAEAQFRSQGDVLNATKAKYDGLTQQVRDQKNKIAELRREEESITGTTEEDAKSKAKLQAQIAKAETQLGSFVQQQQKAQKQYDYEASGIGKLRRERELDEKAVKSEVEALKAEGKVQEANRVKREGTKRSIDNLNSTLDKQVSELNKLKNNGATKEQIKQQEIYVNGTRKNLANARNEYKELSGQTKKSFNDIEGQAKTSNRKVSDIIKGSAIGSLVASGARKTLSLVTSSVDDAMKRLDTLDHVQKGVERLTGSSKEAVKVSNDLSKATSDTTYGLDSASNATLAFANSGMSLKKSTDVTKSFMDAITTYGNGTNEQLDQVMLQMGQMANKGKANAGDLNTALEAGIPVWQILSKEMGQSKAELIETMGKGKLSSEDFFNAIVKGTKSIKGAAKSGATTWNGAISIVQSRIRNAVADGLTQLRKLAGELTGDKNGIFKMITGLGTVFKNTINMVFKMLFGLSPIIKSLASVFSGLVSVFKDAIEPITFVAKSIGSIVPSMDGMAKHKSAFELMGKAIGVMSTGMLAYKTYTLGAAGATKALGIAQNVSKGIGEAYAAAQLAGGLALDVLTGKMKITTAAQEAMNLAMSLNPIGLIVGAVVTLGVAFYALYKHNKKFKEFIDGLTKNIKKFIDGAGKVIVKGIKSLQKNFSGLMKWFKKSGMSAKKGLSSFGKAMNIAWKAIWKPITMYLKLQVNVWKKTFELAFKLFKGDFKGFGKDVSKIWSNIWKGIDKLLSSVFGDMWKDTKKFLKNITNKIADALHDIFKNWSKQWRRIQNFFDDVWGSIKTITKKSTNWVFNKILDFNGSVSKAWHNTWDGLRDFFSDIWKSIKKLAKSGMNGVIETVNKGIKGINGMIHSFGGDKTTISLIPKFEKGTANWRDVMGTSGAGAPPGLAMVNDGNGAEAIVYPDGRTVVPNGRNVVMPMLGGETVIPHEQAVQAGIVKPNAYKNGIGNIAGAVGKAINGGVAWAGKAFNGGKSFVADIIDDVKEMVKDFTGGLKTAWNFVQDPKKAFTNFSSSIKDNSSMFNGSAVKMGANQFGKFGGAWTGELANAVKDIFSGGGSSSGGGKGDDYNPKWRKAPKDAFADSWGYYVRECVSFVANRLNNLGVNPKLFSHLGNGSDWTNARVQHRSKPKPGDVAVYSGGSKYGNHVSIVTGVNGNKFNEEGYNAGNPPNGKYYTTKGLKFSDATTFLNFGAKASNSADEDKEEKSGLRGLVEKQAKKALDNLTNMFDDVSEKYADSGIQAVGGQGVMSKSKFNSTARRAADIIGEKLSSHDLAVLYHQAMTESNVNPSINTGYNDHDGTGTPKGLFQYKNSTFASYAYKGHRNILSALDQFLAVFNNSNWRRDFPPLGTKMGWGPSGTRRFANGGLITSPEIVLAGEEYPEMIVPLDIARKSRSNELIQQAYKTVNGKEIDASQSSFSSNDVEQLVTNTKNLVGLMGSILGVSQQQLQAMTNQKSNGDILNALGVAQSNLDYQAF